MGCQDLILNNLVLLETWYCADVIVAWNCFHIS